MCYFYCLYDRKYIKDDSAYLHTHGQEDLPNCHALPISSTVSDCRVEVIKRNSWILLQI